MIEKAALSVLKLSTFDIFGDPVATGSGFVMFDNRTLITNYHVMADAYTMTAESDEGYQYYITGIKTADKKKDIAIMQFSAPTVMTPLTYSLDGIKRGERVTAIGSPVGLKNSVSMGNISYVFKEADVNWIQTTAPISHGSSGGALFNEEGEVIGVTSATRSDGQNINFAVNIVEALDLYKNWDHTVIKLGRQPGFSDMLCDQGDKYYWGDKQSNKYIWKDYYWGNQEEGDYELAVKYYEKAAELGNVSAAYMLGKCYYKGDGLNKDEHKAIDYLTKAADLGNLDAIRFLGNCYLNSEGEIKDENKGLKLLLSAAEFGNTEAMTVLSKYYMEKKNYDQSYYWVQKAASLGDPFGMVALGSLYDIGYGVEQNSERAFEWYKKSAEAGYVPGMDFVAKCYQYGNGIEINKEKMISWYLKAAEKNFDLALYDIALCYKDGDGLKKDEAKAFECALKAAELGNTDAMLFVGQCYEKGTMNRFRAEEWYQKALDDGDEQAQWYLDNLHRNSEKDNGFNFH